MFGVIVVIVVDLYWLQNVLGNGNTGKEIREGVAERADFLCKGDDQVHTNNW